MGLPESNVGQLTPRMVSQLDSVVAISAGGDTTCALLSDTSVKCWGSNNDGVLGIGTYRVTSSETPLNVVKSETDNSALNNVVAISVGTSHTCILDASRHASCWGYNGFDQLGIKTKIFAAPAAEKSAPVRVDSDEEFSTISAGGFHTCAILESTKAVQCWGNNNQGQLGDGTTKNRNPPVAVSGDGNANVELALGARFSCSLASNAAIRCWGLNDHGELGNGTTVNRDTAGYVIFD
jgi:alpha-tubulin suppressor-like RCC1 family protein